MTDHLWYPEITAALTGSSHLFLHYSAFHRVDDHAETITQELMEAGRRPQSFRLSGTRPFTPENDTNVAILLEMETLITRPRMLERLRPLVNDWAMAGLQRRVLIVSRSPRSAFPIGDGSSLVLDCRDLHLHDSRMADWIISEFESHHKPLPTGASYSRGLAANLLKSAQTETPDLDAIASKMATETLFELGPNYIALLDEWFLKAGRHKLPVVDVPEWMQFELMLAGVAHLDIDQQNLLLFDRALGRAWGDGLRLASRLCTEAPRDWREVAASLFELERIVRRILANALEGSLGNKWAKQVLNEAQTAYVREAAGVATDFPLSGFANPLDYLTLGQLLDLAIARDEAARAGLTPRILAELHRVVPIRNRVGHMRLPRVGDLHTTRSVLRAMKLQLPSETS